MLFQQDWRSGMKDVSAAIDDAFGELVTVTPVDVAACKPNYPTVMASDQSATVTAVFQAPSQAVDLTPSSRGRGQHPGQVITSSNPTFSFDYGALPFSLLPGTRITVCRTGVTFEVTAVWPDSVTRIHCDVVQLGRQPDKP